MQFTIPTINDEWGGGIKLVIFSVNLSSNQIKHTIYEALGDVLRRGDLVDELTNTRISRPA